MNYELAKQLKDAGFPESIHRAAWFIKMGGAVGITYKTPEPHDEEAIYIPTLEELIEACGEKLHCLVRTDRTEDGKGIFWSAGIDNVILNWQNAPTPTEAVARLWLALNKKK